MSGVGASFTWRDANRTVIFGQGALEGAADTLAEHGFAQFDLLSTPRAMADTYPASKVRPPRTRGGRVA